MSLSADDFIGDDGGYARIFRQSTLQVAPVEAEITHDTSLDIPEEVNDKLMII